MKTPSLIHDAEIVAAWWRRYPHAPPPRIPRLAHRIASALEFGPPYKGKSGDLAARAAVSRLVFDGEWARGADAPITMRQAVQNAIDGVLFSALTRGVP